MSQPDARYDVIELRGIASRGNHGVYDFEKRDGQNFSVDVDLYCDLTTPAQSDNLADTVDYSQVAQQAAQILSGKSANLIESVAGKIAQMALSYPKVQGVRVSVHKPQAPLETAVEDVSVTLWRGVARQDAPGPENPGPSRTGGKHLASAPVPPGLPVSLHQELPRPCQVILSLGANLGNPLATLQAAVKTLEEDERLQQVKVSPLVRTAPVLHEGQSPQPDYYNAIVSGIWEKSPWELLELCQYLEAIHGRRREEHWGARTLDIDIVNIDSVTVDDPILQVPHPAASSRAFVLLPWSLLDPTAKLGGEEVVVLAEYAADRAGVKRIWEDWYQPTQTTEISEPPADTGSTPLPQWSATIGPKHVRIIDDPEALVPSGDKPVEQEAMPQEPLSPAKPSAVPQPSVPEPVAAEPQAAPLEPQVTPSEPQATVAELQAAPSEPQVTVAEPAPADYPPPASAPQMVPPVATTPEMTPPVALGTPEKAPKLGWWARFSRWLTGEDKLAGGAPNAAQPVSDQSDSKQTDLPQGDLDQVNSDRSQADETDISRPPAVQVENAAVETVALAAVAPTFAPDDLPPAPPDEEEDDETGEYSQVLQPETQPVRRASIAQKAAGVRPPFLPLSDFEENGPADEAEVETTTIQPTGPSTLRGEEIDPVELERMSREALRSAAKGINREAILRPTTTGSIPVVKVPKEEQETE